MLLIIPEVFSIGFFQLCFYLFVRISVWRMLKVKKLTLVLSLLMIISVLACLLDFTLAFSVGSSVSTQPVAYDGEPTLQQWFLDNGYAINVTTDETGIETFAAGYYKMEIKAEFAAYAPINNLSWYPLSNGQLNYIFLGENVTGDTACFLASETFGFCLESPDGRFYTETLRNADGKDHALIFNIPQASGYIIAWEDLWDLGDADYQDAVLAALTPVNVNVEYCPRTLNRKSEGRWITAFVELPKEFDADDVDVSSIMLNGTILADKVHVEDSHLLVVKFSREEVIELIRDSLEKIGFQCDVTEVSLTLTGKFTDGQTFQGTNSIHVIHYGDCYVK